MEQESMKPCPLCGGEVRIHRRTDGQVDGIVCDECLLTLEAVDVYPEWHTLDELVRRWNARAAVTDEQFATAVHDGRVWRVVRECRNANTREPRADAFDVGGMFKCSECGESYRFTELPYPFCPFCGAKVTNEEEVG